MPIPAATSTSAGEVADVDDAPGLLGHRREHRLGWLAAGH
jgi:hypothetical protein